MLFPCFPMDAGFGWGLRALQKEDRGSCQRVHSLIMGAEEYSVSPREHGLTLGSEGHSPGVGTSTILPSVSEASTSSSSKSQEAAAGMMSCGWLGLVSLPL